MYGKRSCLFSLLWALLSKWSNKQDCKPLVSDHKNVVITIKRLPEECSKNWVFSWRSARLEICEGGGEWVLKAKCWRCVKGGEKSVMPAVHADKCLPLFGVVFYFFKGWWGVWGWVVLGTIKSPTGWVNIVEVGKNVWWCWRNNVIQRRKVQFSTVCHPFVSFSNTTFLARYFSRRIFSPGHLGSWAISITLLAPFPDVLRKCV